MRLTLFFLPALLAAQSLTVSPDGPLKTLAEARDAARRQRQSGVKGPITITVGAGTYFLTETLRLGPEDSETTWQAAPGAHVVISGGVPISGWKRAGEKSPVWTAPYTGPAFRQLFISGRRATRARIPNYGFYRMEGPSPQSKPLQLHYRGDDIKPEWAGRGVEVVAYLSWADLRMPIVSVDPAAHIATLASDPRPSNKEADARYFLENAPEGFDAPGEWFLDSEKQTVSYRPMPGENMERERVIAPVVEQLVRLEGDPAAGRFVRNVTFRGLQFVHAAWNLPAKGYADTQAAMHAPFAIEGVGALDTTIDRCTIAHSGGYGAAFGRGCQRTRLTASELYDLGGGGIKLGEPNLRPAAAEQNADNVVADNHMHDLGLVYAPAVGVWILQSSRNQVIHNHIHDLFYTAISVGWTWGYGENQSKGNTIAFNHLHDIGKGMLSDMGGIYTLGIQPGTTIRNNLIHGIESFTYGGWGIYPDEGSSEILIENNIVYGCKSAGFHQHYGRENIVRNNIFAFNRENQVMRSRPEPHISFTFERNIVLFDQGRLLGSNWGDDKYKLAGNLYWDRRGPGIVFAGKSFADWQASGRDAGSLIADPGFVNADNYDFRLAPNSPARRLGFQPIDMSKVGPRQPAGAR